MNAFDKMESILSKLKELRAPYDIKHVREGALLIAVATPGKRWEIEVLADGSLEVEVFSSTGVKSMRTLDTLWGDLG